MRKKDKGRKMGKVTCVNCGIEFEKSQSEINRSEKLNRRHFCSRQCVGSYSSNWHNPNAYRYDITKHSGWRKDEYTKFRYHYRNIKNRFKDVEITMDDMKEIWEEQKGICPFTGVKLKLSSYTNIEKNILLSASLDRIDSNKGYIKDNIRWVSRGINLMKSNSSDKELWEMCRFIYENYKNKKED